MKKKALKVLIILSITSFTSCSQNNEHVNDKAVEVNKSLEIQVPTQKNETIKTEPHNYGGWYCPDNLNGFPAVNIADWKNVPVVNGRMPTKEETRNGTSLIFVDPKKYPNAKTLNITMPKLANFYNEYSKRDELIIVIQTININNDSIVGFRYLNGGNGSAYLKEVQFLSDHQIAMIPPSRFISHHVTINAPQNVIWEVLTKSENAKILQPIFDKNNELNANWREKTNVNYSYKNTGVQTASYANILFGNYYIQNDYNYLQYNEKFLLLENKQTNQTELKIVSGPYGVDFETQKNILINWSEKVKALSEKK